jgi:non-specific serine/threonine protein kinase
VSTTAASTGYRFGRFELLPNERLLLADGVAAHLGSHAFDLLVALVECSGRLVTKEALLARVWPRVVVEENTLQVHVSALRKVLGADAIATVSGRGYRFVLDVVGDAGPASRPRHNLPNQLTSFIGREAQIAEIKHELQVTRLLTLTGAGGCGKTRLALQVAIDIVDQFSDGVWLVELAPLTEEGLVPQAIARALGVDEQPGKDIATTLSEWLGAKRLVVVLDNAEHLLYGCAEIADRLLRRCAHLTILVTSRERLGIAGEVTYRVPSLSLPDTGREGGTFEALACEAARLFIERARLQRPDFTVTDADAASLLSICERLDGIALAIELAAPRVRHMSLQELSGGLDHRFSLLTGGSRTALPRHRTLRSLIDWSYDSLTAPEKTMLQRVSVFAGGWSLEAAERVCAGENVDPDAVLDLLTSLADKSLVVAETQGEHTRFGMLETVRHYAQDRLRDSGDDSRVRGRHVDYLLAIVDLLDKARGDEERRALLDRLDKERDNLRVAMAWCEESDTLAFSGLDLAGKLYLLWEMRGAYSEGRSWIARLLAVAPDAEQGAIHARAYHAAGMLAYIQADFVAAETYDRLVITVAQRLGDRLLVARATGNLGNIAYSLEDHEAARARYAETLAVARELGDLRITMSALYSLGHVSLQLGDLVGAQAFIEESMAIGTKLGLWSASRPRLILAVIRHLQGDRRVARGFLDEALTGSKELGDKGLYSRVISWLALLELDEGDAVAAAARTSEAITIQNDLDAWVMLGCSVQVAACVATSAAGPIGVARLLGAAQQMREQHGRRQVDFEMQERLKLLVAGSRSILGDDAAFDSAWDEGRSMTRDEAVRYALMLLGTPSSDADSNAHQQPDGRLGP